MCCGAVRGSLARAVHSTSLHSKSQAVHHLLTCCIVFALHSLAWSDILGPDYSCSPMQQPFTLATAAMLLHTRDHLTFLCRVAEGFTYKQLHASILHPCPCTALPSQWREPLPPQLTVAQNLNAAHGGGDPGSAPQALVLRHA